MRAQNVSTPINTEGVVIRRQFPAVTVISVLEKFELQSSIFEIVEPIGKLKQVSVI